MLEPANPVLIEVVRGPIVESRHRGAACVYDATGERVAAWGDVDRPHYPRSAIKILQALPFVETGAADRCQATTQELALACASHEGEAAHVETARRWLARIGLDESHLACGAHAPYNSRAAAALVDAGEAPSPLHNNCSGKHIAMLATALAEREPVEGYHAFDHPVQQRVRAVLAELTGDDLAHAPVGLDGCSLPTIGLSLAGMARALATIADPRRHKILRQSAIRRLRLAVARDPFMTAGSGRFCTRLMERKGAAVYVKTGAEGVFAAAIPDLGLGIALKIDDGAKRASEVALASILRYFEVLDDADWTALADMVAPTLRNVAGRDVGAIRPAEGWPHARAA
jgi:L-asparaginase II